MAKLLRVWVAAVGIVFLVLLLFGQIAGTYRHGTQGQDFLYNVWAPAHALVHGHPAHAAGDYPPLVFTVFAWVGLLPAHVANVAFQVVLVLAAVLTLRVLEVREWWCQVVWLASCVAVVDVMYGNPTLLVVLAAAVVWRYRDRPVVAAVAVGAAVAVKFFLAPVALWLWWTGRRKAAVLSAVFSVAGIVVPWAVIGFSGFTAYPGHALAVGRADRPLGDFAQALVTQLGFGAGAALAVGAVCATGCFWLAWRTRNDDVAALTLVLFGALLLSPIAWIHYAGLLVVPFAARFPRWHPAWLLWLAWGGWDYGPFRWGTPGRSVEVIVCALTLVAVVLRSNEGAPHLRLLRRHQHFDRELRQARGERLRVGA